MPEQRWAIDPLFTLKAEHELGIGKLNFYRFSVSLMNKLPYRFDVGWGEIRDRVHGIYGRIKTETSEKAMPGDFAPLYCSGCYG